MPLLGATIVCHGPTDQARVKVVDDTDEFETNLHADWFAGRQCYDESILHAQMRWYQLVPALNVFVEWLNDCPINLGSLQQLLLMVGTVTSLLLSAAVVIPLSFTYEELELVNSRWGLNKTYARPLGLSAYANVEPASVEIGRVVAESIIYLTCSLFITLAIYISMSITSFRE